MFGFHVNKPVELGLLPATRGLVRRLEQGADPLDYLPASKAEKQSCIGPSGFLRSYTSTIEWEDFQTMLKRAQAIDYYIFPNSLSTMLCHSVKDGAFEVKKEKGCKALYRRIEGAHIRRKRKVSAKKW